MKKSTTKEKRSEMEQFKLVDAFKGLEKKLDALRDEVVEKPNEQVTDEEFDANDVAKLMLYVKIQIRMHATLEDIAELIGEYGPWMFFAIELLRNAVVS